MLTRMRGLPARFGGLAAAVLLLFACATYSIEAGDEAAARGDWDTAFENYRDVAQREPDNALARSRLEKARGEAAALHLARARAGIDAGNLEPAISELKRSLGYRPDPQVEALLARTQVDFNRQEAQRELAKAETARSVRELDTAARSLERALTLNPDLPDARRQLGKLSEDRLRAADLGKQAQKALDSGKLAEAMKLANRAREINREDESAGAVLSALEQERSASEAEREARSLESDGRVGPALDRARQAESARSTDARIDLVERLERKAFDFHVDAAELALRRGDYEDALESYERAYELRQDRDVAMRIDELERRLGPRLDAEQIFQSRSESVVLVGSATGSALGVYIGSGLVVTNAAVLEAGSGTVMTRRQQTIPFERVFRHRNADIGVLEAPGELPLPAAPVADIQTFAEGTRLHLITNGPRGGTAYAECSVVGENESFDRRTRVFAFEAAQPIGSERGPLFDDRGRVVGLVAGSSARDRSLHYGVPIEYALELLRRDRRRR
jgi:tetratricopeptide (TPR) repeat protein